MTFQALLHDLIGLTGQPVNVTISDADGHPALACAGVMRGAVDVLGADADDHEVLFFPLDEDAATGFLVAHSVFDHAAWHDGVLHVELGARQPRTQG